MPDLLSSRLVPSNAIIVNAYQSSRELMLTRQDLSRGSKMRSSSLNLFKYLSAFFFFSIMLESGLTALLTASVASS